MSIDQLKRLTLLVLASVACTSRPAPEDRQAVAAVTTPSRPLDDPRVVCPEGATQKKDQAFGAEEVWCVDSRGSHHGPDKMWESATGQLLSEEHFVRGQPDGTRRSWYRDGQPQLEETCRDGLQDGRERFWHPNGQLEHEAWHDKGRRVKVWRWWNELGRLVKQEDYGRSPSGALETCVPQADD